MVSNGPPTRPRECNGARVTKPIENKITECTDKNGAGAIILWGQSAFGSRYADGNMFVFGHKGGKFVWADLKDSDKVGSYPYPKNKPNKYPYWDNLGADWLYGGIYVYGEYPDDDDLESANVYVEDEPYD